MSDGPARENDIPAVQEVRTESRLIDGFKNVHLVSREDNMGPFLSIKLAADEVVNKYGAVILLEDDVLTAQDFLAFQNDCLRFYERDKRIIAVCGYSFPVKIPAKYPHDVYLWSRFNAWGFGIWKNRWNSIDWSLDGYDELMADIKSMRRFRRDAPIVIQMMRRAKERGLKHGDKIVSYNMFKQGAYMLYPTVSKTKNIGFDEYGINCKNAKASYVNEDVDLLPHAYVLPESIECDKRIFRRMRKLFAIPSVPAIRIKTTIWKLSEALGWPRLRNKLGGLFAKRSECIDE